MLRKSLPSAAELVVLLLLLFQFGGEPLLRIWTRSCYRREFVNYGRCRSREKFYRVVKLIHGLYLGDVSNGVLNSLASLCPLSLLIVPT